MRSSEKGRPLDASGVVPRGELGPLGAARRGSETTGALDYRSAFELAPIGLVFSRNRLMVDCNRQVLEMFGTTRDALIGQSFELLYPTPAEFERTGARIAASLNASGWYADERVMKRVGGPQRGELFWCHVSGRALDPSQPHAAGIWAFEDLSPRRRVGIELTPREREIAALLIEGLTSKLIGKRLAISPRTVDVYRARLMQKYGASTTPELVQKLLRA
jgi:PAS domain S-box-containing protein